jgi:hypothetical protein
METIKNYLDNIFAGIPNSEEVTRVKNELRDSMEDKYMALKTAGKSENEAIGNVIAEFGDIEELLKEMGINRTPVAVLEGEDNRRLVTFDEINAYKTAKKRSAKGVGLGIGLILLGVAILISFTSIIGYYVSTKYSSLPVVVLFIFIAAGIGTIIYYGMLLNPYEYIENGEFRIKQATREVLENEYKADDKGANVSVVLGVMLCIVGVAMVLVSSVLCDILGIVNPIFTEMWGSFGVSAMLVMIAFAVYVFITGGSKREAYKVLLEKGEHSREMDKSNRLIGAVAACIWPVTVAVFLIWGMVFDGWHICWILFPIVGMLFAGFSGAVSSYNKGRK